MNRPYKIHKIAQLDIASERDILRIWEKSMRASHNFFSDYDEEIRIKKTRVKEDLRGLILLCASVDAEIKGFCAISGAALKMLYVHPQWQGKGIGQSLVTYSIQNYGIKYLEVYAQNEHAVAFYEHMGFTCYEKTLKPDTMGKPLPVLRMRMDN